MSHAWQFMQQMCGSYWKQDKQYILQRVHLKKGMSEIKHGSRFFLSCKTRVKMQYQVTILSVYYACVISESKSDIQQVFQSMTVSSSANVPVKSRSDN